MSGPPAAGSASRAHLPAAAAPPTLTWASLNGPRERRGLMPRPVRRTVTQLWAWHLTLVREAHGPRGTFCRISQPSRWAGREAERRRSWRGPQRAARGPGGCRLQAGVPLVQGAEPALSEAGGVSCCGRAGLAVDRQQGWRARQVPEPSKGFVPGPCWGRGVALTQELGEVRGPEPGLWLP